MFNNCTSLSHLEAFLSEINNIIIIIILAIPNWPTDYGMWFPSKYFIVHSFIY